MFSEGSCDTEDWNNDADNSGLNTAIKYILTYKTVIFNCKNVSKFVQIFFQINAALVSRRDLFRKLKCFI